MKNLNTETQSRARENIWTPFTNSSKDICPMITMITLTSAEPVQPFQLLEISPHIQGDLLAFLYWDQFKICNMYFISFWKEDAIVLVPTNSLFFPEKKTSHHLLTIRAPTMLNNMTTGAQISVIK